MKLVVTRQKLNFSTPLRLRTILTAVNTQSYKLCVCNILDTGNHNVLFAQTLYTWSCADCWFKGSNDSGNSRTRRNCFCWILLWNLFDGQVIAHVCVTTFRETRAKK